ncbi:hypothetical protein GIW81_08480 [Hyphomicrobium sp. xq]|uniref:Uncharacterized protein n=1 Tax=Hyphomicrobium album TaxID=2665159 RepID=A0A6I3KIY3_9HYPH|nr:hypothetical protein [Hyphomicrobium album]MTD94368.1 hypothetical protein [Hyphomicrobium album]
MSSEAKSQGPKPTHIAYEVRDPEHNSREPLISRIGAVWPHKDGEGYDVILNSNPVNGRVMLRTARDRLEDAKSGERPADRRDRDERGR